MATGVRITVIKQLDPVTATTATVQLQFVVLGILPELVQIYAARVGEALGALAASVEIKPNETAYSVQVQLQAGIPFQMHVCPRTVTNGVLNDRIDEQPWEAFCTIMPFTTKSLAVPTPPTPKPEVPIITQIVSQQATLHDAGNIVVNWVGDQNTDQYHFMWMEKPNDWTEFEINSSGSSSFWKVAPTFPGRTYSFKVQGCITHVVERNNCSEFTAATDFVMPPPTHSLRKFLRLSAAHLTPGIRSLGAEAYGGGVRAMMRL